MSDIYDTISFLKLKVAETEAFCKQTKEERDNRYQLLKGLDDELTAATQLLADLKAALAQLEKIGMVATEGNHTAAGSRIKPPGVLEQIQGMFAGLATVVTSKPVKGGMYNFSTNNGEPENSMHFEVGDTLQNSKTGVMFKYSPLLTSNPSSTNWVYKYPMDHWTRLGQHNAEHSMLNNANLLYIGRL